MNRRATFISEMDDKDEFNCKLLKAISGNDEISIRNSGSPTTHSVTLKTVLLIATNVVSRYEDATFANRLCCINFPNKFARDDGKAQLIKSHLNDLFCAILEGSTRYYNRGKKIELIKSIKDYTTGIKEEKNPFLQFIKNNSYEKKENAKLLCSDMYIAYVDDLRKNKYEPKGKEKFYLEVEKHFGITKKKINTGNIYELTSVEEEVKTED
jgi:phage/plasmid-associated DNA primase